MHQVLSGLRWRVLVAKGGAEAWSHAGEQLLDAVIMDAWLPDLAVNEFMADFRRLYSGVDMLTVDGEVVGEAARGPYHQELLYALREGQESLASVSKVPEVWAPQVPFVNVTTFARPMAVTESVILPISISRNISETAVPPLREPRVAGSTERLPELIGDAPCMLEVSRRICLVASRSTPVLIEGPTGTGKELVASALHRLSNRARRPFIAINCAAIPDTLIEAELFGHTRGAFTGAVQNRIGRIEAANGGTLFLDEIGELPLAVQAKLLRFCESGELQRVGDNEPVKVDVRIVAATHQLLAERARRGEFRADLYYRLAVFLIRTPALAEHKDDLPTLVSHFIERMGREYPAKRVDETAMAKLAEHNWPGNVRELEHVLERAAILAGVEPWITSAEIDFGIVPVN